MSQLLESKTKSALYQEFVFSKNQPRLKSFAIEASCYVCGKGLDDGHSLTAKNSPTRTLLFCNKHYS
jgi:hypothetical protein